MGVPDPERSNVVIVGTSRYDAADLPDLPAIKNNVKQLRSLLTDREFGIVRADRCEVILDPLGTRGVYRALREHSAAATDTLVLYFAGHGETDNRLDLYLSMTDTDRDDLAVSALAFDHVRQLLNSSPANRRIVILDCCFSGRAVHGMSGSRQSAAADSVCVDGSYVLTATTETARALAPPGQTYTAFTGELIRLLREGVHDAPEMLTIHTIYRKLRHALSAKGLPEPANRMTGTAEGIVLSRNRRNVPKAATKPAEKAPPKAAAKTKPAAAKAAAAQQGPAKPVKQAPVNPAPAKKKTPAAAKPKYVPLPRLMFCHGGATLLSSGRDRVINVWDVGTRRLRHTLAGHGDIVAHWALGMTGTMLATAGRDRSIQLWNIHDGRKGTTITAQCRWIAFHPTEPVLATVGKEPVVHLRNLHDNRQTRSLTGHTKDVLRVSFSPDGTRLLTTAMDRTMRIWDVRSGKQRAVISGLQSPRQVSFHSASGWVASARPDGRIELRSMADGSKLTELSGDGNPIEVVPMHEGTAIAVLDASGRIRVCELATGKVLLRLPADPEPATRILSGPGSLLAALAENGTTRLRDGYTGDVLHTLYDPCKSPHFISFSPDAALAAVGSRNDTVRLYDLTQSRFLPLRWTAAAVGAARVPQTRPAEIVEEPTAAGGFGRLREMYARLRTDWG